MQFSYMHVEKVPSDECFMTVLATVSKHSWEVNVFNMVSQVTSVAANFPTKSAFVCSWPALRVFDNVFIERLVP